MFGGIASPDRPAIVDHHSGVRPFNSQGTAGLDHGAGFEQFYAPTWKFVAPPGVGDAPQHVYNTFALIPFDICGPGDMPTSYLVSLQKPVVQDQYVNFSGYAINSGGFELSPLWAPEPVASPNNNPFAGSGF